MENLKDKLINFKFSKNDIIKSFFIMFFLLFFIFIYINQFSIQFFINGFNKISNSPMQVYFLDVGQANSTLIVFPNKSSMLIDTGSKQSESDLIRSLDLILHKNNISVIDYLVLTHSDEDHVGGAVAVLERYQVYNVFRPKIMSTSELEIETEKNYKVVMTDIYSKVITAIYTEPFCDVDFVEDILLLAGGDASLKFWSCEKDFYTDTNSYSPFITLSYQDTTFMFTGDATDAREKEFVETITNSNIRIDVDFLLVAHHGSKHSTSKEFLDVINPTYAFVSAGDSEHPSKEVLDRLSQNGVEDVFVTKELGMIAVGLEESSMFYIKTMDNFVDLPFIVMVFAVVIFFIVNSKPYEIYKRFSTKRYIYRK